MERVNGRAEEMRQARGVQDVAVAVDEHGTALVAVRVAEVEPVNWAAWVDGWSRIDEVHLISVRLEARGRVSREGTWRLEHPSMTIEVRPNEEMREAMARTESDRFRLEGLLERREEPVEGEAEPRVVYTLRPSVADPVPAEGSP